MAYTLSQSVDNFTPSIVLIGVPDKKALEKVIRKLDLNRIDSSAFYETDNDMGLSAVATVPLTDEQRALLQDYKIWKEDVSYPHSSVVRASASQEDEGRLFESVCGCQDAQVA